MIKSEAAKELLEKLESVRLNLETKYFLAGMIESLSEVNLITFEEFVELTNSLQMTDDERRKITY